MSEKKDNIYIYLWEELSTVYVGRTVNPRSRHYQHRHIPTEVTYRFSSEHHVEHPRMVIIENDLTIEEGIEREKYWIKEYRENSPYKVLNKVKGGGVGTLGGGKWTKDAVFEEAKKYTTRAKLKNANNTVYSVARVNGWLDDIFGTEKNKKPIRKWTKEAVFREAEKYSVKRHFEKECGGAYVAAIKNKWFDEMPWFKNEHFVKWTKEKVLEESKKYSHRKPFRVGSPGAYNAALKNGWLDEIPWIAPRLKWNRDAVIEESKKYNSRGSFKNGNKSAYNAALKNKWIDEMFWLDGNNKPINKN